MTDPLRLPCPTCSGTGTDTHEDRHTETNRDTCRTCGGTGSIPARTGESAEASFRAPVPTTLTPGGRKLADALVEHDVLTGGPLWADNLNRAAMALGLEASAGAVDGLRKAALWCMHVAGPDDLHAAPDFWTALRWAAELNTFVSQKAEAGRWAADDNWPLTQATVQPWPGTAEAHVSALAKEIADREAHKANRDAALARTQEAEGQAGGGVGLTLKALHTANIARQAEWCPDQVPDLSFRGNELAGETGEACNVIKKLERERQGWRGSRATLNDLADELADVVICADLCAVTAGIDLDAAVVAKFNATSDKVDISVRLAAAPAAGGGRA